MKFRLMILSMLLFFSTAMSDRGFSIVSKEMQSENRVALVIGNNAYQRPLTTLSNTINDAQAIRSILSKRGFEVIYRENISHKAFDAVLEEFYQKLARGGVGLLYFSGHGMEVDGQNYLIPTDAKIGAKSDSKYEAVALDKITNRIQKIGNRLNILILDACRNNPFARASGVGGLAEAKPLGLFISYATGVGKVSSDGRVGGNGLFTQYLIENMKKPLGLHEVFKQTRASVHDASRGTQIPAIYDQIVRGDFYFTLPQTKLQPKPKPKPNPIVPQYVQPQPIVLQPVIQTSTSKWITPSASICKNNGGKMSENNCKANWKNTKKICQASGGVLPSNKILAQIVSDCGGLFITAYDKDKSKVNKNNSTYQSCYKEKGFTYFFYYWSSTSDSDDHGYAWSVDFYTGVKHYGNKLSNYYVRCVKAGQ